MGCVCSFRLPLSENTSIILILDRHNAQIKYMQQDDFFASSSFFNPLEGDAMIEETREDDSETQSMKAEGSQVVRKHDIIEIEDSDAAEDDDDDKWAKQGISEDTTMVAVDRSTSSITSTESPTPTTLTSVMSTPPTNKNKRARLHSPPTAPYPPKGH